MLLYCARECQSQSTTVPYAWLFALTITILTIILKLKAQFECTRGGKTKGTKRKPYTYISRNQNFKQIRITSSFARALLFWIECTMYKAKLETEGNGKRSGRLQFYVKRNEFSSAFHSKTCTNFHGGWRKKEECVVTTIDIYEILLSTYNRLINKNLRKGIFE